MIMHLVIWWCLSVRTFVTLSLNRMNTRFHWNFWCHPLREIPSPPPRKVICDSINQASVLEEHHFRGWPLIIWGEQRKSRKNATWRWHQSWEPGLFSPVHGGIACIRLMICYKRVRKKYMEGNFEKKKSFRNFIQPQVFNVRWLTSIKPLLPSQYCSRQKAQEKQGEQKWPLKEIGDTISNLFWLPSSTNLMNIGMNMVQLILFLL